MALVGSWESLRVRTIRVHQVQAIIVVVDDVTSVRRPTWSPIVVTAGQAFGATAAIGRDAPDFKSLTSLEQVVCVVADVPSIR